MIRFTTGFMTGLVSGIAMAVGLTWFGFDAAKDLAREKVDQGVEVLNETRYEACRQNYLESTRCLQRRSKTACEIDVQSLCSKDTLPSLPRKHKEPAY